MAGHVMIPPEQGMGGTATSGLDAQLEAEEKVLHHTGRHSSVLGLPMEYLWFLVAGFTFSVALICLISTEPLRVQWGVFVGATLAVTVPALLAVLAHSFRTSRAAYAVTDRRLLFIDARMFQIVTTSVPLGAIEDVSALPLLRGPASPHRSRITGLPPLVGYGRVIVKLSRGHRLRFPCVIDPWGFRDAALEILAEGRGRSDSMGAPVTVRTHQERIHVVLLLAFLVLWPALVFLWSSAS